MLLSLLHITFALTALSKAFPGKLLPRDSKELLPSYDYIVIGGGTSGLTVANRLSEDPLSSVLVIEAGVLVPQGSNDEWAFIVPAYGGQAVRRYSWNITSAPDSELNGRSSAVASAKIVGGGSVVNGMFGDRGAKADYDAWEKLGNPGWSWEGLLPYFKKSEKYTPPSTEQVNEFGIQWDPNSHGKSGPVEFSYPPKLNQVYKYFYSACKAMGFPTPKDGSSGEALGVFWVPNTLEAENRTRSYAASAYYWPARERDNLHLIAETTVTKILFDSKERRVRTAVGVEYAANATAPRRTVKARRIILAGGAIHSPRILQLSGIGRSALLRSKGIEPVIDLPGVGENFQDHAVLFTGYQFTYPKEDRPGELNTNATYAREQMELYLANRTGAYTVAVGGNIASFIPLQQFTNTSVRETILQNAVAKPQDYLPGDVHADVRAGYLAQIRLLSALLSTRNAAAVELLTSAIAIAHPFSRGRISINSANPFENPTVDYRTFAHPADIQIVTHALRYYQSFAKQPELAPLNPRAPASFPAPGASDAEIETYLRGAAASSFAHPSGTCSMLPRRLGGVVDSSLKVYGTSNLYVVDASIMPLVPGTHLVATVYAVAEKAADLIKKDD